MPVDMHVKTFSVPHMLQHFCRHAAFCHGSLHLPPFCKGICIFALYLWDTHCSMAVHFSSQASSLCLCLWFSIYPLGGGRRRRKQQHSCFYRHPLGQVRFPRQAWHPTPCLVSSCFRQTSVKGERHASFHTHTLHMHTFAALSGERRRGRRHDMHGTLYRGRRGLVPPPHLFASSLCCISRRRLEASLPPPSSTYHPLPL